MSAKTTIGIRQGGGFIVKFKGYDSILVDAVREIRGRKYDPATKTWNLPATRVAAEGLIDLAESYGATIEEAAISALEALAGRTIEDGSGLFMGDNSKPSGFPPTDEQRAVIEAAQAGGDLKVSAYAGAGKTSTLVLIAKALAPRMGVYIAYNRAIADEAQEKFPGNVECRTAHSFAYQAMDAGRIFKEKLRQKLYPRRVAELLSIPFSGFGDRTQINCARAVQATVRAFMQTADEAIFPKHIPDLHLQAFPVPAEGAVDPRTEADMKQKRASWMRFVTSGARDLWELQIDPKRDDVGMTHDHYLKLWQLSKPGLAADFILFDESQDANPVLLDIVTRQKAQKIWVGDTHQQLYSWRGAINAMDVIPAQQLHITQSFRWGPAVAAVANAILNFKLADKGGLPHPVRGFERKQTVLGPVSGKHTLICRGNGRLFAAALEAVRCGQRIAVVGSLEDAISMMESGYALSLGDMENVKHADLKAFQTWEELTQSAEEDHNLENLVKHIEEYGSQIPNICADLRAAGECSEAQADLILTTCHKAKGREWPQVRLAPDYPNQVRNMQEGKPIDPEELNVLYVAATRATERLETNYQVDCLMGAPHINNHAQVMKTIANMEPIS